MTSELQQLHAAIAGLEAQRALFGDAAAEAALAPLRARLSSLSASAPPDQILKQVTILFLDIVGSTVLSQHLDPEEIHAVMDGALTRCTASVESHRGKVLQYAGDSVLAVFGADEAQEDDAERAVHAGLALLAEGRLLGEEVRRQHGHEGFDVRVGLHTGGVLLGGGVDAEGSIRGIAVNIAARMEQSAPAGALRISHDTYRHVRGVFDVESQPPIQVKGLDEPIATYLVRRAKPRTFRVATRGIEGVETRMIGRDTELEQLQDSFKRLFAERTLAAVTVVAEAGLGKSRLLYEFDNWAEARPERFIIFQGRATPQTQRQPYGLLRDIIAWRLQIADDDTLEAAKAKLEQEIVPLFVREDGEDLAEGHAHLLGHLIGLDYSASRHIRGIRDDPRQIRNRAFHAAVQMFRRVGAQDHTPIMLQLEDLHWADDASLDFLKYLVQVNRDVSMLILAFVRPTLFERRPDWRSPEGVHQRIDLGPLDKRGSRELARELLKKLPEVPAALHELVTGGAEGNPFYMEELVKMLIDQGAIESSGENWKAIHGKLLSTQVPQTLTGVLQARLDGLNPAEKLALQQASVIGVVFWGEALAAIDARAINALPSLMRRELIVPRQDARIEGVHEYAFKHQLLHHVTYDTVLKRMRRDLHAKAAAWLAGLTGARASDFLGTTAEHYEKALDYTQAREYFARAAEHAMPRYAHEAVLGYVARALTLADKDGSLGTPALRWRLFDARERTLDMQGRRSEQRAALDALHQLAETVHDNRRRAELALRRSGLALHTGDYRTQNDAASEALELAASFQDEELRLNAVLLLTISMAYLGDAGAKELAQRSLIEARALGLRRVEAKFLSALPNLELGSPVASPAMQQEALMIWQELGDKKNEAILLTNLGIAYLEFGQFDQAQEYLEKGLRLNRAVGDRANEPVALVNLSQLALWRGDYALALAHALTALDVAVTVQAKEFEALALWHVGNAELSNGRPVAAAAAFDSASAVSRSIDHLVQHDATASQARVALTQNDEVKALECVEALLPYIDSSEDRIGTESPRLVRLTCYRVLSRVGDSRAANVLVGAFANLQAIASTITDETLRHSFLNNIPEHHEIVAAWAAHQASAGSR